MPNLNKEDMKETQQDISFLSSLPKKTSTTVRFFDKSEYYHLYGDDAIFVAKETFKTLTIVKYIGEGPDRVPYIWLSKAKFESQLRDLLLIKHYRIEIYKNVSTKGNDWQLLYKASPGNLTQVEDLLFTDKETVTESERTRGVLAIKLGNESQQKIVGVAYGDAALMKLLVSEFVDNDSFSNLQACTVHLSPKECLIIHDNSPPYKKIQEIMERNNILVTELKPSDFNSKDIIQDLNRLLKFKNTEQGNAALLAETDLKYAMSGVSAVIKYLELLSDEGNFGHFTLKRFDLEQYVRLDSAAVRALGLMPVSSIENKTFRLYGLLNKCRTVPGQRLLAQWIKQPLIDINKIEERLSIVQALVNNTELRQTLYEDHMRKIPDLERMAKLFLKKKATLKDCYKVYQTLGGLPSLIDLLSKCESDLLVNMQDLLIAPLQDLKDDFEKFREMVETTLDLEQVENGEFMVRPDFDQELKEFRNQMTNIEEEIKGQLHKVAKDLGLSEKTLKLENSSDIGYYFRVTRKEEKALRNKNYITIDAKQNGVRFHNHALKKLNEKYVSLRADYENHQKEVVELIIGVAAGYSDPMQQLSDILAQLDVFMAFSMTAITAPQVFVRPKLLPKGSGVISLKQARHPCLEVQENIDFIPNDITLEREKKNFHIITGPNMGGKSTFIRSVALNCLMAQIGSFVACDEATISIVDSIMTRVGAGDIPLKGVSTFMAEMLETASILKSSSEDTLIIIDELGRGTSTYDGFGLAWAISEHIATKINAYCLFATHFHELTALENEVSNVNNLHVTALTTGDDITFLYKVKQGVCDQSFGVHVAELAHFPPDVIELSRKRLLEVEDFHWYNVSANSEKPEGKTSEKEYKEAEGLIKEFLSNVSKIPCDKMTEMQAIETLSDMKAELMSKNNKYIKELLSKASFEVK